MKKFLFCLLAISLAACAPKQATPTQVFPSSEAQSTKAVAISSFEISSPAFTNGGAIPSKFSCTGENISPALTWTEPPAGTQSFVLIMDDPDAPTETWVHWVIFDMPVSTRNLTEGMPTNPQLSDGSLQGYTSAGSTGYNGPCPPSGTHRYFFKLYALDTVLSLPDIATGKAEAVAAMEGHILAKAELMGTFSH
jgi:Raf kinase inhibitor-like YbhB/YbcL family protein